MYETIWQLESTQPIPVVQMCEALGVSLVVDTTGGAAG
jgi:hypothetical protein